MALSPPEPAPERSLPGLGWLRRLYRWVLGFAETPHGMLALFVLAFVESSFFPIPPDVLLIALALGKPRRGFLLAGVCTMGSVLGGMFGWFIGYGLWETVGQPIVEFYNAEAKFHYVQDLYRGNAFAAIAIAGFTPIPYKVFTIAAGLFGVPMGTLVLASVASRGARFFLVSTLIYVLGDRVRAFIERYFDILTLVFTVLLVGGFLAIKFMSGH